MRAIVSRFLFMLALPGAGCFWMRGPRTDEPKKCLEFSYAAPESLSRVMPQFIAFYGDPDSGRVELMRTSDRSKRAAWPEPRGWRRFNGDSLLVFFGYNFEVGQIVIEANSGDYRGRAWYYDDNGMRSILSDVVVTARLVAC